MTPPDDDVHSYIFGTLKKTKAIIKTSTFSHNLNTYSLYYMAHSFLNVTDSHEITGLNI